jgi:hypothetical protein
MTAGTNFRRIRKASRFMKFEKSNHTNGPRRENNSLGNMYLFLCVGNYS